MAILLSNPANTISFADESTPSPKEQIRNGILPNEVKCTEGLELIFKISNNSPACIKLETKAKIIERGWGIVSLFCLDVSGNYINELVLIPEKKIFKIGEQIKADIINCSDKYFEFNGTDYDMKIESVDGKIVEGACSAGEAITIIPPYTVISGEKPWQRPPCNHFMINEGVYWIYLKGTDTKGKYQIEYTK